MIIKFLGKVKIFFLVILFVLIGVYLERIGFIDYITDPFEYPYVLRLLKRHVFMVTVSMFLATITGLVVGIIFTRPKFSKYSAIVMYIVGLGQTIPTLAVLALSLSVIGIGFKSAVFALYVYSVLPIARNTIAGILSVPPEIKDAAKGTGLSNMSILFDIEIPYSMSVIITGFRVALVINIGTAALGYLIGAGGLGELIFTGINLMDTKILLAGAIPTTLLALFGDFICELATFLLVPKGLRLSKSN
jgi:osmoprotectant transport system permease protein